MNIRRRVAATLIGVAASMCIAHAALAGGTLLRWQKMGEEEGGTNNSPVFQTLDSPVDGSDFQALDLFANNSPTYRTISGRPDGGGGIGIEFSAGSMQFLSGQSLNWPQESALSDSQGGLYDLAGISNRDLQFWVRPTSTSVQSLVMDTNQHGVRINSNGRFSMRYAGVDYESTLTASPNTWYHVQVARPSGVANRARLYINGNAVAVSPSVDYAADNFTPLTVGSNTTSDGEFFSGIIDELRMSVFGTTTSSSPVAYGTFAFATGNAFAASPTTGLKGVAGDVTNDGFLTQADKDAFIAGWMSQRLVNGFQIGDLTSYGQGDLNLDGITNIQDLLLMQNALSGSGLGTISGDELAGVPEPATLVLLLWAILAMPLRSRRSSR